jgi:hypothetical protein
MMAPYLIVYHRSLYMPSVGPLGEILLTMMAREVLELLREGETINIPPVGTHSNEQNHQGTKHTTCIVDVECESAN